MTQHRRNSPAHHRALLDEKLGRGPRLPAAERRQAILAAACHVFSERSFRGATTAEIARAAGVSEPILYRHFASKTELYLACLEDVWLQFRATASACVAERPESGLGAIAERYYSGRERLRLIDFWIQSLTEAADDPKIRAYLRRQIREVHDFFAELIRDLQTKGIVYADRDPQAEAWIFLAGGLLATMDGRLGGILGDDIQRVKRERQRWMLLEPPS